MAVDYDTQRSYVDRDSQETKEWLEAFDDMMLVSGPNRCRELLARLTERARLNGISCETLLNTPYCNTIPPERQPSYPGNLQLEKKITALIRWNALAMVLRSNRRQEQRAWRPFGQLCVIGRSFRDGIQSLLSRKPVNGSRYKIVRFDIFPTPFRSRCVRARVSRRQINGGESRSLPSRGGRHRFVLVPTPQTDARILGIPYRIHGIRPDHRNPPGALLALP